MRADRFGLGLVGASLVAAIVIHAHAMTSAFVFDDFVYLQEARSASLGSILRLSFWPRGSDTFYFAGDFYRPLYFFAWWPLERLFGDSPWGYHAVVLAVHVGAVAMVALLARELGRSSWLAGGLAAAFFAVHPVPVDAVNWISSLNSVSLPLGLAGMLFYFHATRTDRTSWPLIALSVVFLALALGFRETAAAYLLLIGLWHVAHGPPRTWHSRERILVLVPYVVLGLVYLFARTHGFTVEPTDRSNIGDVRSTVKHLWYYWRVSFFPVAHPTAEWSRVLSHLAGLTAVALVVAAAALRRWRIVFAAVGAVVAALPFATLKTDLQQDRYVYFAVPFAAIALALGTCELRAVRVPRQTALNAAAGAVLCAAFLLMGVARFSRSEEWVTDFTSVYHDYVHQLRTEYPTISTDTVCLTDTPFELLLFDAYVVGPLIKFYYPNVVAVLPYDKLQPAPEPCGRGATTFDYRPPQ